MNALTRALRPMVRPLIAGSLLAVLAWTGMLDGLDALISDGLIQRRGNHEPSRDVTVIGVTDECLKKIGPWPWSRAVHARLVERLAASGAKVVLWDMVLADPGADPAGDRALAAALTAARNVVLPISAAAAQSGLSTEGHGYVNMMDAFSSLPAFNAAATGLGHTFVQPDADGVVRRMWPELRVNGKAYTALSLVGANRLRGAPPSPTTDARGRLRLNYYGPTGVPFEVLPFHVALSRSEIGDDAFRGRIVVVGGASQALHDLHTTPVGRLFGLEVLATAASNVLLGDLLHLPSAPVRALLVLLASLASGLASLFLGRRVASVVLVALAGAVAYESVALLSTSALLLPYSAIAFAGLAAWMLVAEEQLASYRSREEIEQARLAAAATALDGIEAAYRGQRVADGLTALATVSEQPLSPALEMRARTLKLRGLLLRREELELETFLEREDLTRVPASELVAAATDLERRGREDLAEKVLVALEKSSGGPTNLPVAESLARVRKTMKKGAQDSPLLGIARRAMGEGYQKVTLVGVGGMGFVVRALRLTDERWVAVKFLSPAYSHRMDYRKRFEREATILSRLAHPAVIEYLGVSDGEPPFYVMEYFPSTGLNEVLAAQKKLDLVDASRLLAPVARALEVAHRQDVVHRDVKPSNILIGLDGRVKLTDFGIAKAADLSAVTATGDSLGTPDYMSPEQLLTGAAKVTTASDVYSFALCLYEALCGDLPSGRGAPAFAGINRKVPTPAERGIVLPPRLEAMLMTALAIKVAERTVSVGDLAGMLELNILAEPTAPAPIAS